jgi:hypothetical protein
MSHDSREAFEQDWKERYTAPDWVTKYEKWLRWDSTNNRYHDVWINQHWETWQAAQSRHAAEREALVRKLKEMLAEANRKTMHGQGESFAINAILALLDSGSQG